MRYNHKSLLTVCGILILLNIIFINQTIAQFTFQRTYGFSAINEGMDIVKGIDNGYLIAANTSVNTNDCYVIKLNDNGTIQWQNIYGGNNIEHAKAVVATSDSCYVIAG